MTFLVEKFHKGVDGSVDKQKDLYKAHGSDGLSLAYLGVMKF